jgi:hypothetical protein
MITNMMLLAPGRWFFFLPLKHEGRAGQLCVVVEIRKAKNGPG